jgi:hypothetical protein
MPAPRPLLGLNDLHLVAKVLDVTDDAVFVDEGFSLNEMRRARQLFAQMDEFFNENMGEDWNDQEALV